MKWQLKHFTWLLITSSTIIVFGSLIWNMMQEKRGAETIALAQAHAYFKKDQAFRHWATTHGGIYVPVTDKTQPSPYLAHIPDRDIENPAGQTLTLMNPAYMVRQMNEAFSKPYGVAGHITSLKPLRPGNAPDAWEREALQAFEQGRTEVVQFTEWEGTPVLRLMRPMVTKEGCLKCHSHQGHQVGDIRGGVAVMLPMRQLLALVKGHNAVLIACHMTLWFLMLLGIVLGARHVSRSINQRTQAEDRTKKSEEKYRMLFNSMLDGFALHEIICDDRGHPTDYRFLDVNPSFERLTGLDKEAILGKTVLGVLPGTETHWITAYGKVALTGEPLRFENFSGELDKHYEILAYRPRQGQFACIFQDITARKRAETALQDAHDKLEQRVKQRTIDLSEINAALQMEIEQRKVTERALLASEDKFAKAFHNAPVLIGISRLNDGTYLEVNKTFAEKTGFTYEEAVGKTSTELGLLDTQNRQQLKEALERDGHVHDREAQVKTKGGDSMDCLFSAEQIDLNGQSCLLATVQDITHRKQAEKALYDMNKSLVRSEQTLRKERDKACKYFDIAGTMLTVIAPDQTVRHINQKGCEIIGLSPEEIIGTNWFDRFLPARSRVKVKEVFQELINGHIEPVEYYVNAVVAANGQERIIAWRNTTLADEQGNVTAILGSGEDITEERQAQNRILEYQGKLRSLASRLSIAEEHVRKKTATILHDSIGQSLVSCRLLLGAERQTEDLVPHLSKTFDTVIDILEHATEETKELTFDLASPTLYKLGLIPALEEWLTETIQAQHKISAKVTNHGIPETLEEAVSVMAFRSIKEISFNVVKHAQAHHIEISLEMADDLLFVTVLDDGIGFDYEQMESNATSKGQFGLFSIKERLGYMGGRLLVETAPTCGTKVTLTIPAPTNTVMNT